MKWAYFNEIDPFAAQWLRNLMAAGHIPQGEVDERSIADVSPDDLRQFRQCHFFAGIGGWAYAARLAGWPDDRELWTGSPPCQPFSVAGKGLAQADERHLWPHYFRLIAARRPAVCMGEQVAAAVGKDWLDGVCADLESIGYACGAAVVPACAVNAPHRRDRLWFVALANIVHEQGQQPSSFDQGEWPQQGWGQARPFGAGNGAVAHATGAGSETRSAYRMGDADEPRWHAGQPAGSCSQNHWATGQPAIGWDGKARRVEPSIRLLAHGVPGRVGRLRAYGNAIVPQVAAEVISAYMEAAA